MQSRQWSRKACWPSCNFPMFTPKQGWRRRSLDSVLGVGSKSARGLRAPIAPDVTGCSSHATSGTFFLSFFFSLTAVRSPHSRPVPPLIEPPLDVQMISPCTPTLPLFPMILAIRPLASFFQEHILPVGQARLSFFYGFLPRASCPPIPSINTGTPGQLPPT